LRAKIQIYFNQIRWKIHLDLHPITIIAYYCQLFICTASFWINHSPYARILEGRLLVCASDLAKYILSGHHLAGLRILKNIWVLKAVCILIGDLSIIKNLAGFLIDKNFNFICGVIGIIHYLILTHLIIWLNLALIIIREGLRLIKVIGLTAKFN